MLMIIIIGSASGISSLPFEKMVKFIDRDKMGTKKRRGVHLYLKLGKALTVFFIGSFIVHIIVMVLDYYLMIKPLYLDLQANFAGSILSPPMYPMMAAYGLLSLTIYLLWEKKKKALLLAREKEIQSEKVEVVLKSMQTMTGILAEHIATHNAEIMRWVEIRKRQGHQVSKKVENPNKKIADVLQSLSEISFVWPYTENRPKDIGDIEKIVQSKLGSDHSPSETAIDR